MNEVAICKIMSYIENNLFEPGYLWDKHIFKERSYSRWAAYEILERIMDNPFSSPDMKDITASLPVPEVVTLETT